MKFDTTKDVAYLGGYNASGTIIYIDSRYPRFYYEDNKKIDSHKYLAAHEIMESKLIKELSYNEAHRIAAHYEKELLKEDEVNIENYYKRLYYWVNFTLHNCNNPPDDLDLKPYEEDNLVEVLDKLEPNFKSNHPVYITKELLRKEMWKDILE